MLTLVLLHMEDFVLFHAKRWINNKLGVTGRHTLLLEGKLKSIAFRTLQCTILKKCKMVSVFT